MTWAFRLDKTLERDNRKNHPCERPWAGRYVDASGENVGGICDQCLPSPNFFNFTLGWLLLHRCVRVLRDSPRMTRLKSKGWFIQSGLHVTPVPVSSWHSQKDKIRPLTKNCIEINLRYLWACPGNGIMLAWCGPFRWLLTSYKQIAAKISQKWSGLWSRQSGVRPTKQSPAQVMIYLTSVSFDGIQPVIISSTWHNFFNFRLKML
jgi:hypothetical protein